MYVVLFIMRPKKLLQYFNKIKSQNSNNSAASCNSGLRHQPFVALNPSKSENKTIIHTLLQVLNSDVGGEEVFNLTFVIHIAHHIWV